jgi:Spy/CpxP family protein refolding chaperone
MNRHDTFPEEHMTTTTRIGLGLGGLILAIGLGLGTYAVAQDQNTSEPPHARMGPGGPHGPRGMGMRGLQPGPMGQAGPHGMREMMPFGQLDLTEAQRAQVRTLVETHRAATDPVLERAQTARQALHAAVTAGTIDEGAIRARSAELASAEADLAVARARLHADITKILTPEQQTELEANRSRMAERMQSMRERRGQRGGPAAR